MFKFAISSWSVDGLLTSGFPLLELPAAMKAQGLGTLELCHFHLPSTEPEYLADFRAALTASDIELFSVLIDTGDIASPDPVALAESLEAIRRFIDVAASLGAERVRVSAGVQPATPETLEQSAQQLTELMAYAEGQGVKVSTENWQLTAQQPDDLLAILDAAPQSLGLCADTGNAEATPDKYGTLERLMPRATSVHFKARRQGGEIDREDARRCLELMREGAFGGPVSLIYDGKQSEWDSLRELRETLRSLAPAETTA